MKLYEYDIFSRKEKYPETYAVDLRQGKKPNDVVTKSNEITICIPIEDADGVSFVEGQYYKKTYKSKYGFTIRRIGFLAIHAWMEYMEEFDGYNDVEDSCSGFQFDEETLCVYPVFGY